jgi:hypothetical protein
MVAAKDKFTARPPAEAPKASLPDRIEAPKASLPDRIEAPKASLPDRIEAPEASLPDRIEAVADAVCDVINEIDTIEAATPIHADLTFARRRLLDALVYLERAAERAPIFVEEP